MLSRLPVGTRTLLFGVHQFLLHPFFVAKAWIMLYGWPWHPAIWLSFVVHDWGYWGLHELESGKGLNHVQLGAKIVQRVFGPWFGCRNMLCNNGMFVSRDDSGRRIVLRDCKCHYWSNFNLFHSRQYAQLFDRDVSPLCLADKLSIALVPAKLYLALARFTGEIDHYLAASIDRDGQSTPVGRWAAMALRTKDAGEFADARMCEVAWHSSLVEFVANWVHCRQIEERETRHEKPSDDIQSRQSHSL